MNQTIKERCRYILRKYPETKYDRGRFMWQWLTEYHEAIVYVMRHQFLAFWKDEAGIERSLRDVLKEKEFELKPEQNSKRYERQAEFKEEYKNEK